MEWFYIESVLTKGIKMAHPSVVINGVTYSNVPEVDIPKQGGGTAKFFDASQTDAAASNVLSGKKFVGTSGEDTGTMTNNGATGGTITTKAQTVNIPAGYTSGGSVSIDATEQAKIIAGNIKQGVTLLGQAGSLALPLITQDQDGILSIS